jgi:hypothetical protein
MDTENLRPVQGDPEPPRTGRTKRIVITVAASTILLGSGAALGMALTGGASASTGSPTASTSASATSATTTRAAKCLKIAGALLSSGHAKAASHAIAFCRRPLLRLALVGGEYGQVTYKGKSSPQTIAFERGTVESVSTTALTVSAPDGTTWTWDLTSGTKVRSNGSAVPESNLTSGGLVLVGGPVVNGVRDARLVRIRQANSSSSGSTGTGATGS